MTFGTSPAPTVPLPNTQKLNGSPLSSGGGIAVEFNSETLVNTNHRGHSDGEPLQRSHRGDGRQRQLRDRLAEPEPGRQRLGRLRPAVQRQRQQGGQRVPRQHHHGRRPGIPRPWR